MEKLIEQMRGRVDKGEVYYVELTSRGIEYKGWKLHRSESSRESGCGVRVIVDGKVGTSSTADTSPESLRKMLDASIDAAKLGEEIDLEMPGKAKFEHMEISDPKVLEMGVPSMVELGNELMSKISKYRESCDMQIGIDTSHKRVRILNTEGFNGEYEKTYFSVSGSLIRVQEGDIFMVWESYASTRLPDDLDDALNPILEKFERVMRYADRIVPPPKSSQTPVVFSDDGMFVLLIPLLAGINGLNIYSKTSPIFSKIGEKIFDDKFSVYDDGTIDGRVGSSPFDDEGVPKRKLPIVESGVLKNFLFDLTTAHKSGFKSNGCASRSIFSPPQPSTSNIVVAQGDVPLEDMIADIKEGIIVESVLGLGQGNVVSGAFSNPISTGFKIENGEVVGRIKNMAIAGNIYDNLKEITAISKERRWVYETYLLPSIRLDNVSVVSK